MAYPDFKSYIQANYEDYLKKQVSDFVNESHDAHGFHSINVLSLCDQEVDNLEVKSIRCTGMPDPFIKIDINLTADIVMLGIGTTKYEADRKKRWITVTVVACLRDGMTIKEEETRIKEYAPGTWDKTTALDEFGVPYIYTADLEDIADDFYDFYCKDADYYAYEFPYKHVLEALEIEAYEADLPEDNMGRMYFRSAKETVFMHDPNTEQLYTVEKEIQPGTMLISATNYFMDRNYGSRILTIAHEIIHWYYHQKFFKILYLLDDSKDMMPCDVTPVRYEEGMSSLQKAMWFVEWQANAIGMRIAMPSELFVKVFKSIYYEIYERPQYNGHKPEALEEALHRTGYAFGVSQFAAKQRAIQLGLASAAGTHLYINGHYHRPFIFDDASIDIKQTYTIDEVDLKKLRQCNKKLDELLNDGTFIYLGYVVCINDEKYIEKVDPDIAMVTGCAYDLNEYARNHADECCLIFNWESVLGAQDDAGFYGQAYLSKDISAASSVEHTFDPHFKFNMDKIAIAKELEQMRKAMEAKKEVRYKAPKEFADALIYHMDRRKITVEQLAERSGLSVTTISNYRNKKKEPDLENLMAIFIGLNLQEKYCDDFLKMLHFTIDEDWDFKQQLYRMLIREHSDGTLQQWNAYLQQAGFDTIPNQRGQKTK